MIARARVSGTGRNLVLGCPDCAAELRRIRLDGFDAQRASVSCLCGFAECLDIRLRDPYTPGHGFDVRRADRVVGQARSRNHNDRSTRSRR